MALNSLNVPAAPGTVEIVMWAIGAAIVYSPGIVTLAMLMALPSICQDTCGISHDSGSRMCRADVRLAEYYEHTCFSHPLFFFVLAVNACRLAILTHCKSSRSMQMGWPPIIREIIAWLYFPPRIPLVSGSRLE